MIFQEAFNIVSGFPIQIRSNEGKVLYDTAEALADNSIIVEIGTKAGGSAYLLGSSSSTTIVFTIDNYTEDVIPEKADEAYGKAINNLRSLTNVCALRGNSTTLAKILNFRISLLFVDGDHSEVSVNADLEAWLPHVKKNGFVVFHDYDSHTGITIAVNKYLETKQLLKIEQNDSLLVTQKI